MVSRGCVRDDKNAARRATWPPWTEINAINRVGLEPQFAKSPQTPSTGQRSPLARRVLLWGEGNGGMGMG